MQRYHSRTCLFAVLFAVACGNTRTDPAEEVDGGQSSNDGAAPDRAQPGPPAQASLFFVIGPPGIPGQGCAISGNYVATIGGPPKASIGDPGPREVDGVGGARIGCRVSGDATFDVSGSAEKNATAFVLLGGMVSAGQGTGTISVAGPGTAGRQLRSAANACDLLVNRAPYQVIKGAIWAEFDCPVVTNPSDPGSTCSAKGEFVLENCEQ